MCGIAGIVHLGDDRRVNQPSLEAMAQALVHRGPDDFGYFKAPGIGLASRRLSIVGVSDGHQPVFNDDGSVVVVFNGELFDYPERRLELELNGHRFRTNCDTELLTHLWDEYGEGMVERLRGQFAFALYDKRRQHLILARDRTGIIPLHFSIRGDVLYFGSEIKALFASGCVPAEADPRGIDHIFTFFAMGTRRTAFRGVQAVPAACFMRFDLSNRLNSVCTPTEHRYWDLRFPESQGEYDSRTEPQLCDEFGEIFRRAVGRRLRADVPVVGYLSGGLDSALVMKTAAEVSGSPIPAFNVSVPTKGFDEGPLAKETARLIGSKLFVTICDDAAICEEYPNLVIAAETPVVDTACAAMYRQAREIQRNGFKVALCGDGADEWMAGYPWFKTGKLMGLLDGERLKPGNLLRRLGATIVGKEGAWKRIVDMQSRLAGPNGAADMYSIMCLPMRFQFYSREMWERIGDFNAFDDLDLDTERMRRWHPLNRALYLGSKTILAGMLLCAKGDRPGMANSVEARYPFLDEEVIDFCAALPPHMKLRGITFDKYLFRKYASTRLPAAVAMRRKKMFRAPTGNAFLRNPPPFVNQLLSPESLRKTGYFDVESVQRCRENYGHRLRRHKRTSVEMGLVSVIATQLWHHSFLGGGLCDLPAWTPPKVEATSTQVHPVAENAPAALGR